MQIADKYAPQQIESKWYDYWIEQHIFHSEPDQREPYTIVIPPEQWDNFVLCFFGSTRNA